ncbi:Protein of unknown function [Bacillus cytotoxicus]|uniref:Uncharacterized protein n=2 Tax=Bacillus cytotoxicus TaxID=580165 RepID=A0AAX2CFZ6_9BACI|nr:Protein of unknown function [Bacillus cytotoxicus]
MPEVIDLLAYRKNKDVAKTLQAGQVPLGLDFTNIEVVAHDIAVNDHLMIYSADDNMRKQVVSSILSQMNKDYFDSLTLVDTAEYSFVQYKDNVMHYIVEENEINVHVN